MPRDRADEIFGGLFVGGDGDVVESGYAQQRFDVGIVRLHLQRIPKEDHHVYLAFGDFRADLLVAAQRSREIALDFEFRRVRHEFCRRARSAEFEAREKVLVRQRPLYHFVFFVVVRDQRDHHLFLHDLLPYLLDFLRCFSAPAPLFRVHCGKDDERSERGDKDDGQDYRERQI